MVMGIVNVTPDSFSDGARYFSPETAVARGRQLFDEGAAVVDVGGESTRPGAEQVPVDEEMSRVVDVVAGLAPHGRVSIDTTKPEVARAAVAAGAEILNDVSASLHDVAAELNVTWIAVHRQGTPATMQVAPQYDDVVAEVCDFLAEAVERGRPLEFPRYGSIRESASARPPAIIWSYWPTCGSSLRWAHRWCSVPVASASSGSCTQ